MKVVDGNLGPPGQIEVKDNLLGRCYGPETTR
jgi:hypothetical protein